MLEVGGWRLEVGGWRLEAEDTYRVEFQHNSNI